MMAQLFFVLFSLFFASRGLKGFQRIYDNIHLGQGAFAADNPGARWKNLFLVAFGQRKMFKNYLPAILHGFIYVAFLFTQVEFLEIAVDGIFGQHRFFAPFLGPLYGVIISTIEILSFLALIATVAFLWRRNVKKVARFDKPELKGWPAMDANIILFLEIVLISAILFMNGADKALQAINHPDYHHTGVFAITSWLGPWLFGGLPSQFLVFIERFGWWLHYAAVMAFFVYLSYSKHLHVILAFFNTWYANLGANGHMNNIPAVTSEVKAMLGLAPAPEHGDQMPTFGASDILQMSKQTLLGAYSCTECGRCTAECPANKTGKKLSPRKIMMDIRDRADEVGKKLATGETKYISKTAPAGSKLTAATFDDGRSLFDLISREEIHACTTCNACVEACPILINPLAPILELRRHEILTQGAGPSDWLPMFNALENTGAVWQMPVDRENWTQKLG